MPLSLGADTTYKFQDGVVVCNTNINHLDTAISYLYVKEKTNNNDGKEVEMFLRSVSLGKGYAWCAAFVSYCLEVSDNTYVKVRSASALAFRNKQSIPIRTFKLNDMQGNSGDILVFQYGKGKFGHVEIIYSDNKKVFRCIGGNTTNTLTRDGNRVAPTMRYYKPYARLHIVAVLRAQ